jgi:pantoate--beta-alanine ligase
MRVIEDIQAWQKLRPSLMGSVGFVPTMGALHDGHASLLRASRVRDDITVLSIYVNPTQFNDPKDLANYPDTLSEDLAVADEIGVDYVIMPRHEDIYSDGYRYQVTENELSNELCGANRPGHFTGVLTVVMKLLNLVRPQRAYFGNKDYQQYLLVRDMAQTFFLDVEVIGCETVRECDGLAMSSRNKLLSADARRVAGKFNKALRSPASDQAVQAALVKFGVQVDYIETRGERRFGAIVVDSGERSVRLIDNVEASEVAR